MDHKSSLGAQVAQVAQAMRAPLTPPTDHSDLSDRVDDDLELPTKLQDLSLSSPPSKVKLPNGSAVITNGDGAAQEKMRVFLVQTAHGLAPSSGGFKANYYFLVQLAQDDHNCAQICYAFDSEILLALDRARRRGIDPKVSVETFEVPGAPGPRGDGEEKDELKVTTFINEDRILCITICRQEFILYYDTKTFFTSIKEYLEKGVKTETGELSGVSPHVATIVNLFENRIDKFEPTHLAFNDALTMKIAAIHPKRDTFCRIAIIHTAEQLPFGPFSQGVDGHCLNPKLEDSMLRDVDGIWAVSQAIKDYSKTYGDLDTKFLVHSPLTYKDPQTRECPVARFNLDKNEVGMVNPCPHKGMDILVGLARELPHIEFVTWASWGSGPEHIEELKAIPNITVMGTTRNTDEIWDRIKILIAPSVWHEAWGIIVTEAQLRGIPVVASDAGGLPEAKIGLPYVIPVKMVTGKRHRNGYYVVPEQDIKPWKATVEALMTDPIEYTRVATMTAVRSRQWLNGLDTRAPEKWMLEMARKKQLGGRR